MLDCVQSLVRWKARMHLSPSSMYSKTTTHALYYVRRSGPVSSPVNMRSLFRTQETVRTQTALLSTVEMHSMNTSLIALHSARLSLWCDCCAT